ncbi:MAG: response regulator, partial [bacterium]
IMLPSDENIDYKQYNGLKINDFIEKPLRHLDLLDKVCSCLGKQDVINPSQSTGLKNINIKKLNILLAEDDEINREVIAKLLKKVGHSVKIVENGKDVLKAIKNNDIDVILMDIKMPEMDGFKATKKIRSSNSPYSKIPIIAMTACVLPGDKQKCIELGMNGYISKPIDGMILVKEVDRIYKENNNN